MTTQDIFISYNRRDITFVSQLVSVLRQLGYKVWLDVNSLHGGQYFPEVIQSVIEESRCVIVVWSEISVSSRWVYAEAARADARGILLPVVYQNVEPPLPFNALHNTELMDWNGDVQSLDFQKLLGSIKRLCPVPSGVIGAPSHLQLVDGGQLISVSAPTLPESRRSVLGLMLTALSGVGVAFAGGLIAMLYLQHAGQQPDKMLSTSQESVSRSAKGMPEKDPSPILPTSKLYPLRINTVPKDARITVDGKPWSSVAVYKAGRYAVKISADGYHSKEQMIEVTDGAVERHFELTATQHSLTIQTVPANARIEMINSDVSYQPGVMLSPDEYWFKVTADGYKAQKRSIKLVESSQLVKVSLVKKPKPKRFEFEPKMMRIPAGSFSQGCLSGRDDVAGGCDLDEKQPAVKTTVPEFWMSETEVTLTQFTAFVDATGYVTSAERKNGCWVDVTGKGNWGYLEGSMWRKTGFDQQKDHPVSCVSWDDTQEFISWLNNKTGKYYSLPTEAQWEYAVRGGNDRSAYAWGNEGDDSCAYANVADLTAREHYEAWGVSACDDGYIYSSPVKTYLPNAYELYDMHGNVLEWVQDEYDQELSQNLVNEQGGMAVNRVIRGGSWAYGPGVSRAANRSAGSQGYSSNDIGFRLVETRR